MHDIDRLERLLALLALNDEASLEMVLARCRDEELAPRLGPKVELLIRLGALLALGAPVAPVRATVEHALAAGATEEEITDVLITVAPAAGLARVVEAAPRLASALGYEADAEDD